jgi:hypothetical protein
MSTHWFVFTFTNTPHQAILFFWHAVLDPCSRSSRLRSSSSRSALPNRRSCVGRQHGASSRKAIQDMLSLKIQKHGERDWTGGTNNDARNTTVIRYFAREKTQDVNACFELAHLFLTCFHTSSRKIAQS